MRRLLALAIVLLPQAASAEPLGGGVVERLIAWSSHVGDAPDLRALTTEPVANTESSGFGWRDDPIRHDVRFHYGTDYHSDPGTPVLAAGDGVVVFAGRQGGYGNVIYVDHG